MQQLLFETDNTKDFWFHKEGCKYYIVDTETKLARMRDLLMPCKLLALDIETSGLDIGTCSILGISFCAEVGLSFYVPLNHYGGTNISHDIFVSYMSSLLESKPILGHNLKFDYKFIKARLGITLNCKHDTYIIAKLLDEFDSVGLKYLGEVLFDFEVQELSKMMKPYNLKVDQGGMLKATEMYEYACQDTDLTLRLFKFFWETMDRRPDFVYEMEIDLIYSIAAMETRGVQVDYNFLKKLKKDYTEKIYILDSDIKKLLGLPVSFDLNSNQKLGIHISNKYPGFKDKLIMTEKSGVVRLNDDCIAKYVPRFNKYIEEEKIEVDGNFFELMRERKTMVSLVSKYLVSWIKRVEDTKNTTIYTNFNSLGAGTGRMSSNDPNMQNVAPKIRHAIVPRKGFYFYAMDYDQVEYRILAGMADLTDLIEEINKGNADVHEIAASMLFDVPIEEVTKELRKQAKTLNFGLVYGMGAPKLAEALSITVKEAEKLTELYKVRFLKGTTWFDRVRKFAKTKGYVLTAYGRKRKIDNLNFVYDPYASEAEKKEISKLMGAAFRKAVNTPIQGTSADITKMGLNKVHNYLVREAIKAYPVLVIHDEIIFEVSEEYTPEEIEPKLRGCLEIMFKDKVHLSVDKNISKVSWGAMKE